LFEGKHYFTIIDFVNAYHLFSDSEWDGEPIEPEPKEPKTPTEPKPPKEPTNGGEGDEPNEKKVKIRLSDGKVREIQSMSSTMFYLDGKPISAEEFLQRLFNTLNFPQFFGSEDDLRKLWANPVTRKELLKKLEEQGCGKSELSKIQEMIEAENSDLFDVLEYVSYARKPITRAERVSQAQSNIYTFLNERQRDFIGFVLRNYVQEGVEELDTGKLSATLTSKYGSVYEGQKQLGDVDEIKRIFVDFQQHLYNVKVA
jgi:type I restriction enzyme R subunit